MSKAAPPAGTTPAAADPSASQADGAAADATASFSGADATPSGAAQEPTSAAADAPSRTKEDFALGTHAGLDDDALQAKMRQAQERLEGLDKHVADLKRRSEEQDAIAKVRGEVHRRRSVRAEKGLP